MKTVRQANKWFANHILQQQRGSNGYRCSKFVVRMEVPEGCLLYNVVSGELLLLENNDESEKLDILISKWFYISNDFNELDWVDFLRKKKRKSLASDSVNSYTIMTTLDCNARCFYCYEKGRARTMMSEQTAIDLSNYIVENAKGKPIHISWFGGEPLVNYNIIDIISEKLNLAKVKFSSSMISNGLLFSSSLIDKAVSDWNLRRVQITLDGTKEVYLRSKAFVNSDGSEFEKVLMNIESLLRNKISVTIRLNQDVQNTEDLLLLIDLLKDKFAGQSQLRVYNHLLFNDENLVSEEQQKGYFKLRNKIIQAKFATKSKLLEGPKTHNCMADGLYSRVITPEGKIGKCEHFSSDYLIGSIYESKIDEDMFSKWTERIERQEECSICPLFPICNKIKMCPNENPKCNEFERVSKLHSLKQAIMDSYKQYCRKVKTYAN